MNLVLEKITPKDLPQYKADMQEAFQLGAVEGGFDMDDGMQILPESDIDHSLGAEGSIAYKALLDGEMVGGAIVVIYENKGHLDFLYVKHGIQSKGIGKFIWYEIERLHPEIKAWKTCTPYFEKRNIHFYVNVCKFHIVELFNPHHQDPNSPEDYNHPESDDAFDGMFEFEKLIS